MTPTRTQFRTLELPGIIPTVIPPNNIDERKQKVNMDHFPCACFGAIRVALAVCLPVD